MNEKARLIDINEWVQTGEGTDAVTYISRTDDSVLLRMNVRHGNREDVYSEYVRSLAVESLGISTPKVLEFVTDGLNHGIVFQRIDGKKSLSQIISEHPEQVDDIAAQMAQMAHGLHSVPCDTGLFDNVGKRYIETIDSCGHIPERLKVLLRSYASAFADCTTCLHGDLQPGNIIRAGGKDYWIDAGRFGYGDPDLDFSSLYILSHLTPKCIVQDLCHISIRQMRKFTDSYGRAYYGERYGSPELRDKLEKAGLLRLGVSFALSRRPKAFRFFYIDTFYGNSLRAKIKMMLMDLLARKYKKY